MCVDIAKEMERILKLRVYNQTKRAKQRRSSSPLSSMTPTSVASASASASVVSSAMSSSSRSRLASNAFVDEEEEQEKQGEVTAPVNKAKMMRKASVDPILLSRVKASADGKKNSKK